MHFTKSTTLAAIAALPLAVRCQTYTDCNPTNETCPADTGLDSSTFYADFTTGSSANASFSAAAYTTINYGSKGAEFTINKAGQAPTIQTDFYLFFGTVEVKMQAAPGTGIVSSIVLESDDLDEIDWEFLGGNTAQVETNYFGKGNTTTYDRAIYYPVSNPQTSMHTYLIDWTAERLQFSIDGAVVRTLEYADANGGANYPQTPMRLKLGSWAGGAEGQPEGTVEWAGGQTDFSKAPFTMYVESVKITNANPATSYTWSDKTGSWQSIKIDGSKSSSGGSSSSNNNNTTTASVSGKTTASSTATTAPTSSHSVVAIKQTAAAVAITKTGAAPTTTVSSDVVTATGNSTTMKTAASATTQVPAGQATGTHSNTTHSNSSLPAQQTTNGAATLAASTVFTGVVGVALAFFAL
ncbi:copper resistance protein [Taxawa tesnikishii (nom. ined.)]|nr:copper resistance protein [Dothideales sp. JES 119]